MTPQRTGSLNKAARLIVLRQMQAEGTINSMTREQLATYLHTTRPTIQRDLRDLAKLDKIIKEYANA